jgi:hypothetical protein
VAGIRDELTGPVLEITGIGAARSAALAGVGVNTLADFITAPLEKLATTLNLPTARVTAMKQDLTTKHNLGLTFR